MRSLALLAVCPLWAALQQAPGPSLEPDGDSGSPSISDDGRYVTFESRAANFVAGDQKDTWDVFLLDRESGAIERVSDAGALPARSPVISGDGRFVVFLQAEPARATPAGSWNETDHPWRVLRRAREGSVLESLGEARPTHELDRTPESPSCSRDGMLTVFSGMLGSREVVWRHDAKRGTLRMLPLATNVSDPEARIALYDPRISADGKFVAFGSTSAQIAEIPADFTGQVVFNFDNDHHVFRHEMSTGKSEYASHFQIALTGYGGACNPHISADGRYVAYDNPHDPYTGAMHVGFVSDLEKRRDGRLLPMQQGDAFWQSSVRITWLSGDGRRVLVQTQSSAVPGIPADCKSMQTVLRDLDQNTWEVVSRAPDGSFANDQTWQACASQDASVIAFASAATNLVPGDRLGFDDVFLLDRGSGRVSRVAPSRPRDPAATGMAYLDVEPNAESSGPSISDDGRFVTFVSLASNFDATDTAGTWDVFLADLDAGMVRRISTEPHVVVSRPSISSDGRYLAYFSSRRSGRFPNPEDLHVHDVASGQCRIFEGVRFDAFPRGPSDAPQLTRDGSRVAFTANTSDVHERPEQALVLDLRAGKSEIVSLDDSGEMSRVPVALGTLAPDGGSVAFLCASAGMAPAWLPNGNFSSVFVGGTNAYVRDLRRGRTQAVSEIVGEALGLDRDGFHRKGSCSDLLLAADGSVLAFSVSVTAPGEPPISIGFVARRTGDRFADLRALVPDPQTFVGSMGTTWLSPAGTHVLVSAHGPGRPFHGTGRFAQVMLGNLADSSWTPLSRNAAGEFANRSATNAVASADLSRIVFESEADNLVPGDTNNARDLFLVDRKAKSIARIVPR